MIRAAAAGFLLLLAGQVAAGGPLTLDTDGASERFSMKDGGATGFFADLLTEVFAAGGQSVEFHVRPWARCFEEARFGSADGLFAIYRFGEREQQFLFADEPLYVVHEHIFVRRGQPVDGVHWRDALRGKRVGIVNGSYHGQAYQEAAAQNLFAAVETANSAENLATMLVAGRIEAAFSTDELMDEVMSRTGAPIEAVQPALEAMPVYVAFTRKRDMSAVRDAFDRELHKMKQDGRYDALIKKYAH